MPLISDFTIDEVRKAIAKDILESPPTQEELRLVRRFRIKKLKAKGGKMSYPNRKKSAQALTRYRASRTPEQREAHSELTRQGMMKANALRKSLGVPHGSTLERQRKKALQKAYDDAPFDREAVAAKLTIERLTPEERKVRDFLPKRRNPPSAGSEAHRPAAVQRPTHLHRG